MLGNPAYLNFFKPIEQCRKLVHDVSHSLVVEYTH